MAGSVVARQAASRWFIPDTGKAVVASIEERLLLPLDPAFLETRQPHLPPLHNLDPVVLHERLMIDYVFALLSRAAVESIVTENAARMTVPEENTVRTFPGNRDFRNRVLNGGSVQFCSDGIRPPG